MMLPRQGRNILPEYPYPTEFNVLHVVDQLSSEESYKDWKSSMWHFIQRRGLIGFIDGTAALEESNKYHWERSDNLVREWILTTLSKNIRLQVLDSKTAKDMWTELEKKYDTGRSRWELDDEKKVRQRRYLALHKAAINGDWEAAWAVIISDPRAVRTPITPYSQGALTLAVLSGSPRKNIFVRKLLRKMTPEDVLNLVDDCGMTALHYAAQIGNIEAATMLVAQNPHLPNVRDKEGRAPIHMAALTGKKKMVKYLLPPVTSEDILSEDDCIGGSILSYLSWGELFDIAIDLLEKNSELAFKKPNPLDTIAEKRSLFPSGSLSVWEHLTCSGYERIQERRERQHPALKLVRLLCEKVSTSDLSTVEMIFKPALLTAARVGIPEIIEQIVLSYPLALFFISQDGMDIFKYAIFHRHERVFNLINQIDAGWRFITLEDSSGNNGLHMAACLRSEQQINLKVKVAGAVLQMQREVQWYKEVEKHTAPGDKERRNRDGMTPKEVFTDTHQDLLKEAKKWLKDTTTSCTIVAALIATMTFTAALTIPGGFDPNDGKPSLSKRDSKKWLFLCFGIFDGVALFSSITSVLLFLLILTSHYTEEDFLTNLPSKLIVGLITLFVSIISTMVAFVLILYLVFGNDTGNTIIIVATILAGIPGILFARFQFPRLVEITRSTYCQRVFGKQSDRVLG